MRQILATIAALLIAAAILLVGNGLQSSLLSVRGNLEGFSLSIIGLLLSSYFVGFMLGCRLTPRFVKQAGHIRAFTALASIASASALTHALAVEPLTWMALRAVTGFCFAGLYMILESWINEKASNENRGQILSIYRMVDLSAQTVGNLLLSIANPLGFTLFALTSILISLALVPVALTTSAAPEPITTAELRIRKLMRVSPLGVVGVFSAGVANSAFWALGPVFVLRTGHSVAIAATFMSVTIIGGALTQFPVGYLSDHFDRRIMIIIVTALAVAASLFLAMFGQNSLTLLLTGALLFGAFAMNVFGLSVAHANDHTAANEFLETNGGLLLVWGAGSVLGPVIAPGVMVLSSASGLFYYTAGIYAALILYGLYRMTRRPGVEEEEREDYIVAPRTSPAVFQLDPRAPEDGDGEENAEATPESG